ncbi:PrpR N-terminal domain-containing protein [Jeotgalibacillus sp. ET6]|uniref:sigma-54-dependent Fis family transcriptional regulator n=1 Tax=Jeotgalibacillus sp. ET6 TaxID=3037260 RepID=UPI0024189D13|nr:sigma-54-dependent Fis family transcriptional regulator [Jeotgalibacillus sp. ET6]MDG5472488.1 PrpR N-terminal domain-containing protein [Jeotgalibacillus sp. ET6]
MKAMLIAPYSGMAEVMKQLALPSDVTLDIRVANLDEGEEFARQAELEDYDVLISRGGTALTIEKAASLPVIHIDITGYDMLRVFTLIKNMNKKVALVGFSSITQGAATLCNILEYDVEVKTVHTREEVKPLLEELKAQGFQAVIGDVITVQTAESTGIHGVLITSGKEALLQAVEEARRAFSLSKKVKHNFSLLHETFLHFPHPMAIVDEELSIREKNEKFDQMAQQDSITFSSIKRAIKDSIGSQTAKWIPFTANDRSYMLQIFCVNRYMAGLMFYPTSGLEKRSDVSIHFDVKPMALIGDSLYTHSLRNQLKKLSSQHKPVHIIGAPGTGRSAAASFLHIERFKEAPFLSLDGAQMDQSSLETLTKILLPIQKGTLLVHRLQAADPELIKQVNGLIERLPADIQILFIDEAPYLESGEAEALHLLPLVERRADIPAFAHYFLTSFHMENGSETLGIKSKAMDLLQQYTWPGNLNELKQTIRALSRQASGFYIEPEDVKKLLEAKQSLASSVPLTLSGTLKEIEKRVIDQVLNEENGNQSKAAKRLGINRSTLWRKLNDE